MSRAAFVSILGFLAWSGVSTAEDRTVIVGAGGTFDAEPREGTVSGGINLMIELELIDNWLELELEGTLSWGDRGLEVPIALLFKKPFAVTRHIEIMLGLGPELVLSAGTISGGLECATDFMFWPTRHIGFWVEPSYEVVVRLPASSAFGATSGVTVGW